MGGRSEHDVPTEYQDSTLQPPVDDDQQRPPQRHQPGLDADHDPRDMQTHDGNLLELPDGATFGTAQQPSPQERERLLRDAAQAEQEMQDAEQPEQPPAESEQRPGR